MNSATPPLLKPRPRYGRWVLLGLALMITPVVVVGVGVLSMLRLSGDATALRREVMIATDADWDTKVQVSVGRLTLASVRTGLSFVNTHGKNMDDARLALSAVRSASVGVYGKSGHGGEWSREQLLVNTDERMRKRGFSRVVGVTEHNEAVLVYASDTVGEGDRMDLCIAVIDGDEMVIVSTTVDASILMTLAGRHMPKGGMKKDWKFAGL